MTIGEIRHLILSNPFFRATAVPEFVASEQSTSGISTLVDNISPEISRLSDVDLSNLPESLSSVKIAQSDILKFRL